MNSEKNKALPTWEWSSLFLWEGAVGMHNALVSDGKEMPKSRASFEGMSHSLLLCFLSHKLDVPLSQYWGAVKADISAEFCEEQRCSASVAFPIFQLVYLLVPETTAG